MNNWIKIMSFDNMYEAEIRKQLLQNADIQSVVINARDSLFLIGNVDLYVHNTDDKKALIILEQFQGLTKINSFLIKEPIILLQEILKLNNIDSILKEKESEKYILENYELYVKNEQAKDVVPFLTGEKLEGWKLLNVCTKVRQTALRVEVLKENNIESLVIKKRDSDFHLEDISIFVKESEFEKAKNILAELKGWSVLRTYKKIEIVELKEDILAKEKIGAIILHNDDEYNLCVKAEQLEKAEDIAKSTKEWVELRRHNTFIEAEGTLLILKQNGIESSILTIKDSMFLIGGYAVYIEKIKMNEAMKILTEVEGGQITE